MNKKTFCVIQHYRVEVEIEAESEEQAKELLYGEPNLYTVSVIPDRPDRTSIISIEAFASETLDDEVYTAEEQ